MYESNTRRLPSGIFRGATLEVTTASADTATCSWTDGCTAIYAANPGCPQGTTFVRNGSAGWVYCSANQGMACTCCNNQPGSGGTCNQGACSQNCSAPTVSCSDDSECTGTVYGGVPYDCCNGGTCGTCTKYFCDTSLGTCSARIVDGSPIPFPSDGIAWDDNETCNPNCNATCTQQTACSQDLWVPEDSSTQTLANAACVARGWGFASALWGFNTILNQWHIVCSKFDDASCDCCDGTLGHMGVCTAGVCGACAMGSSSSAAPLMCCSNVTNLCVQAENDLSNCVPGWNSQSCTAANCPGVSSAPACTAASACGPIGETEVAETSGQADWNSACLSAGLGDGRGPVYQQPGADPDDPWYVECVPTEGSICDCCNNEAGRAGTCTAGICSDCPASSAPPSSAATQMWCCPHNVPGPNVCRLGPP